MQKSHSGRLLTKRYGGLWGQLDESVRVVDGVDLRVRLALSSSCCREWRGQLKYREEKQPNGGTRWDGGLAMVVESFVHTGRARSSRPGQGQG